MSSVKSLLRYLNKSIFIVNIPSNIDKRYCLNRSYGKCASSPSPPWKILFFGSDKFAVTSLQLLCGKLRTGTLIDKLDVCSTTNVDWCGKHNSVYDFAQAENLKLLEWPISENEIADKYDIGVVISFGYLIPEDIIRSFPLGMLNVHGSLLPKWRGAAPIIRAVLNGDSVTGVTIMRISPHKFDVGDIVRQYSICIKSDEKADDLTNRLADVGARQLMECFRDLPRSLECAVPQSKDGATYAKKITAVTAKVNWNSKSAVEVYNQYRALCHLYPLTTYWFDHLIKILDIELDDVVKMNPENEKNAVRKYGKTDAIIPGLVEYSKRRSLLRVQCKDGKWVCIRSLIISGKKQMTASEFNNGFVTKVNDSLCRKFEVR